MLLFSILCGYRHVTFIDLRRGLPCSFPRPFTLIDDVLSEWETCRSQAHMIRHEDLSRILTDADNSRNFLCSGISKTFRELIMLRPRHAEDNPPIYDHHWTVDGTILSQLWVDGYESIAKVIQAQRADRFRTVFELSLTIFFDVSLVQTCTWRLLLKIILTSFMPVQGLWSISLIVGYALQKKVVKIACIGLRKSKCSRRCILLSDWFAKTAKLVGAEYNLGSFVELSYTAILLRGIAVLRSPYSCGNIRSWPMLQGISHQ